MDLPGFDDNHAYRTIQWSLCQDDESVPGTFHLKLEIITGLDRESLVTDIAGRRNTSIQVHTKSLLDLGKNFDFLKEKLARHEWANQVAWRENDDGNVDVVDVIARLSCFNIKTYPDRHTHPVDAYRCKSSMLNRFKTHPERYERLVPIIRDVLFLHDWIAYNAKQQWQAVGGASGTGGKYGSLGDGRTQQIRQTSLHVSILDGDTSDHRLRPPVVLPILATFRRTGSPRR